MELAFL